VRRLLRRLGSSEADGAGGGGRGCEESATHNCPETTSKNKLYWSGGVSSEGMRGLGARQTDVDSVAQEPEGAAALLLGQRHERARRRHVQDRGEVRPRQHHHGREQVPERALERARERDGDHHDEHGEEHRRVRPPPLHQARHRVEGRRGAGGSHVDPPAAAAASSQRAPRASLGPGVYLQQEEQERQQQRTEDERGRPEHVLAAATAARGGSAGEAAAGNRRRRRCSGRRRGSGASSGSAGA